MVKFHNPRAAAKSHVPDPEPSPRRRSPPRKLSSNKDQLKFSGRTQWAQVAQVLTGRCSFFFTAEFELSHLVKILEKRTGRDSDHFTPTHLLTECGAPSTPLCPVFPMAASILVTYTRASQISHSGPADIKRYQTKLKIPGARDDRSAVNDNSGTQQCVRTKEIRSTGWRYGFSVGGDISDSSLFDGQLQSYAY